MHLTVNIQFIQHLFNLNILFDKEPTCYQIPINIWIKLYKDKQNLFIKYILVGHVYIYIYIWFIIFYDVITKLM